MPGKRSGGILCPRHGHERVFLFTRSGHGDDRGRDGDTAVSSIEAAGGAGLFAGRLHHRSVHAAVSVDQERGDDSDDGRSRRGVPDVFAGHGLQPAHVEEGRLAGLHHRGLRDLDHDPRRLSDGVGVRVEQGGRLFPWHHAGVDLDDDRGEEFARSRGNPVAARAVDIRRQSVRRHVRHPAHGGVAGFRSHGKPADFRFGVDVVGPVRIPRGGGGGGVAHGAATAALHRAACH